MEAACKDADTSLFFPDKKQHMKAREVIRAYCDKCPVKEACLEAGLSEEYGIWGGTTPDERKHIRLRRRREARQAS